MNKTKQKIQYKLNGESKGYLLLPHEFDHLMSRLDDGVEIEWLFNWQTGKSLDGVTCIELIQEIIEPNSIGH